MARLLQRGDLLRRTEFRGAGRDSGRAEFLFQPSGLAPEQFPESSGGRRCSGGRAFGCGRENIASAPPAKVFLLRCVSRVPRPAGKPILPWASMSSGIRRSVRGFSDTCVLERILFAFEQRFEIERGPIAIFQSVGAQAIERGLRQVAKHADVGLLRSCEAGAVVAGDV